jgi:hypothetical protein
VSGGGDVNFLASNYVVPSTMLGCSISKGTLGDAWEAGVVVSVSVSIVLEYSKEGCNFTACWGDLALIHDDKIFTNFFGSTCGLKVNTEGGVNIVNHPSNFLVSLFQMTVRSK